MPADAYSGPCSGRRVLGLEAAIASTVPRDGAVSFRVYASEETCLDALAPALGVEVTRGDEVVPGTVYMPGGAELLAFVPDAPWAAGAAYVARIAIHNDAIGLAGSDWCDLSEPWVTETVEFTSASAFSQALPTPPPPVLTTGTTQIDDRYDGITCCPPAVPESDDSAGGDGSLGGDGCVYLFAETFLLIESPEFAVPVQLRGQVVRELVVDGVVAARGDESFATRSLPVCASVRLTHLGTGEQVESATECPSEEVAAALGVHPRDVAAELQCEAPVLCPSGDGWDPTMCEPFDLDAFPPAPVVPVREEIESECPGRDGPGIVAMGVDPGASTESGGSAGSGESDSGESESGAVDAGEAGCGCTQARGSIGPLVVLGALLRRRRR